MAIAALRNVLKVFSGDELNQEETGELAKESLLLILARAAKSDSNVAHVEVSTVRRIIREATGEDIDEADIRVAAGSGLFETKSLDDALSDLSHALTSAHRAFIARSLADVIRSDARISEFELDFFDAVVTALAMRPCEIAGLHPPDGSGI